MNLFGNKTIYFIDSENVNDNWLKVIDNLGKSDEIKVFYTEKSANISPASVKRLISDKVNLSWIECFTGKNALDFQLVTELGYCVGLNSKDKFVIVSNDKGYEAVVKYWVIKGIDISREEVEMENEKTLKRSRKKDTLRKTENRKKSDVSNNEILSKQVEAKRKVDVRNKNKKDENIKRVKKESVKTTEKNTNVINTNSDKTKKNNTNVKETYFGKTRETTKDVKKTVWKKKPTTDIEYVEYIGRTISVSNLSDYHIALTNLFGQGKGTKMYHMIKDDSVLRDKIGKTYIPNKFQRLDYLVRIFLSYNKMSLTDTMVIIGIVDDIKCKDLNEFYKKLSEKYGEEKGRELYNIFKGIFKILKDI